ncbi:MAG: hypothetical protein AAGU19_08820 [Prolixibacteraceae bacterium]
MADMKGWVSIHRSIRSHWIWEDVKRLKWWLTILLNVNHDAKKFPVGSELFVCHPGQSFRSIAQWTELFCCSKKTTLKFFDMLRNDSMITTEILGKGNQRKHLLTVTNWDRYQKMETENSTETVPETPPKQYPNVPPNNNVNNGNNENNENNENKSKSNRGRFTPPTLPELELFFNEKIIEKKLSLNAKHEAERFEAHYSAIGWMIGKNKMKNWKSAVSGWVTRSNEFNNNKYGNKFNRATEEAGFNDPSVYINDRI